MYIRHRQQSIRARGSSQAAAATSRALATGRVGRVEAAMKLADPSRAPVGRVAVATKLEGPKVRVERAVDATKSAEV